MDWRFWRRVSPRWSAALLATLSIGIAGILVLSLKAEFSKVVSPALMFLVALLGVAKDWSDRRKRGESVGSTGAVVAVLLFALLLTQIVNSRGETETEESVRQTEGIVRLNQELLERLGAYQGDPELLRRLAESEYQRHVRVSETEAKEFAREFVSNLPERREAAKDAAEANERAAVALGARFDPTIAFVLAQVDQRVEALSNEGISIRVEKHEVVPSVVTDRTRRLRRGLRSVRLTPSERTDQSQLRQILALEVRLWPAVMESGAVVESARLFLDHATGTLARLELGDGSTHLVNYRAHELEFKSLIGDKRDPMEDEELRDNLVKAVNSMLAWAVLRAERGIAE